MSSAPEVDVGVDPFLTWCEVLLEAMDMSRAAEREVKSASSIGIDPTGGKKQRRRRPEALSKDGAL